LPATTSDGTSVTKTAYANCRAGGDVVFYEVRNGGHTWPGGFQYISESVVGKTTRNLNANQVIWNFFKNHPMR